MDAYGNFDYIFTIDSDLVVLECKKVMLYVNYNAMTAWLFDRAAIHDPKKKWPLTTNFRLLRLCGRLGVGTLLLVGCIAGNDYVKAASVAIGTAVAIVEEQGHDVSRILAAAHSKRKDCDVVTDRDYDQRFRGAMACYYHAVYYSPRTLEQQTVSSTHTATTAAATGRYVH